MREDLKFDANVENSVEVNKAAVADKKKGESKGRSPVKQDKK
jgi:hypothetical protein